MKRRDFLKLSIGASISTLINNSCYIPNENTIFPFGTNSKKYNKRYFKLLDHFVKNNKDYLSNYFKKIDQYLIDYKNSSRKYKIKNEDKLKDLIKPLRNTIEFVTRDNLSDKQIFLLHGKSNQLFNKLLERILRNNTGASFMNKIILKTNHLSLNLIIHEYGHSMDNKLNIINYLIDKKEKIRAEMVAEYHELYMGYYITKLWNKEIGQDILDQASINKSDLNHYSTIKNSIQKNTKYENARFFNLALLNDFKMDFDKFRKYLINNNQKKVFNKLQNIEKKSGSLKEIILEGQNKLKDIIKELK